MTPAPSIANPTLHGRQAFVRQYPAVRLVRETTYGASPEEARSAPHPPAGPIPASATTDWPQPCARSRQALDHLRVLAHVLNRRALQGPRRRPLPQARPRAPNPTLHQAARSARIQRHATGGGSSLNAIFPQGSRMTPATYRQILPPSRSTLFWSSFPASSRARTTK